MWFIIAGLPITLATSSPEWEADLILLRRSADLAIPFEPSKRRRIKIEQEGREERTTIASSSFAQLPTTSEAPVGSPESFYTSLVDAIKSMNVTHGRTDSRESKRISQLFLPQFVWPAKVPSTFRSAYVDIVNFDRAYQQFAPDLLSDTLRELLPQNRFVSLNETIVSATETAVVFHILHSQSVLKYQCDCHEEIIGEVHPVLLDWWFLRYLEPLGISPKARYVSPPSSLKTVNPARSPKLRRIRMTKDDWRLCRYAPAGSVRFLVMQKAGESLHQRMSRSANQRMSLERLIQLGISSIRVIRTLHEEAGVVHGDIHAGNICSHPFDENEVMLIDFGKAFFVKDMPLDDEQIREPLSWSHALFSPWDILGKRPGKRDDVFKIFLTMALVLNGPRFTEYLTRIEMNSTLSFEWKQDRNFFITQFFDFREEIPGPKGAEALDALGDVLRSVRAIPSASHRPPYEWILERLEWIHRHLFSLK